jgi:hypothetical protein
MTTNWKITNKLAERARHVGQGLKNAQDNFGKLYSDCCEARGGKEWNKGDYEDIMKDVQSELKRVMVDEGHITSNTFHSYCQATRKCMIFDVPWSFARRLKIKDLMHVKKIRDGYDDDASNEDKLTRAMNQLLEEKKANSRKEKVENGMAQSVYKSPIGLPLPEEGEPAADFLPKLFQNIKNYFEGSHIEQYKDDAFVGMIINAAKGGLQFHKQSKKDAA